MSHKAGRLSGTVCRQALAAQSQANSVTEQYSEYFYVNLLNKKSQWELPEAPATAGDSSLGAPPSYDTKNDAQPLSAEKTGSSTGETMFGGGSGTHKQNISADEEYARKLQAEEDARAHGSTSANDRGAADAYYQAGGAPGTYGTPQQSYGQQPQQYAQQQSYGQQQSYSQPQQQYGQDQYSQQQQQQSSSKSAGGFLSKLLGKGKTRPSSGGYYPPQQPHPNYYQQQPMYAQQPGRRPGGGMGMGTGMALGAGGGLLGGVMLGEALGHGGDDGGYGGDDGGYGGGDGGGGDFGGGDGGGDFGGGDGGGGDF